MRFANPLQLDELAGGDVDLVAQIYLIYTLYNSRKVYVTYLDWTLWYRNWEKNVLLLQR